MARHSAATLTMRLFALGAGFLFAAASARLLGARDYGIVAVALSTASIVATFALLGTDGLSVREVASEKARKSWGGLRSFLRWSGRRVVVSSLLAGLILAGSANFAGEYRVALFLAAITVPLFAMLNLTKSWIQGLGDIISSQFSGEVLRWIVSLLAIAILFAVGLDKPAAVIVATIIALLFAMIAGLAIYWRRVGALPAEGRIAPPNPEWGKQASTFLAVALFGIIGTEISTLLLGWLSGPSEAGLYQPIAKLAPVMLIANSSIEAALAPKIVDKWQDGEKLQLQRMLRRSAASATLATSLFTMLILLASPHILGAFGEEFKVYQKYLFWIGAAQVINSVFGASHLVLAMIGDMRSRLLAQGVTLMVQASLALLFIPKFGALGAVISLTAAILTWAILHWWIAWRATGINTFAFAFNKPSAETESR